MGKNEDPEKHRARSKIYYEKNKEKINEKHKKYNKENEKSVRLYLDGWKKEHAEQLKKYDKIYHDKYKEKMKQQKIEAFDHYCGQICCWCGENDFDVLSIDHINNDGNIHRKSGNKGISNIYRWLKDNNYPEGFQVLCNNCNWIKYRNGGVLPKKRKNKYVSKIKRKIS